MEFSELVGVTLKGVEGCEDESDLVRLFAEDGRIFRMEHYQDCCERVRLVGVNGDVEWLIGQPIVQAECVENPDDAADESGTWTFYKLSTVKGTVVLRWLGSSNGYYSERVDFVLERDRA